LITVVFVLAG